MPAPSTLLSWPLITPIFQLSTSLEDRLTSSLISLEQGLRQIIEVMGLVNLEPMDEVQVGESLDKLSCVPHQNKLFAARDYQPSLLEILENSSIVRP